MIPKECKRLAEVDVPADEDRRECNWLYVVTDCATSPQLQEPIKDPARFDWHEVTKVAHYYLLVDAMTRLMLIREERASYGRGEMISSEGGRCTCN
jgi:hypothetical protein